jgi:hypothetical protein
MKYFARYLFIMPTCLLAASSWSQQLRHDVAHAAVVVVAHTVEPALRTPMSPGHHLTRSIDSSTQADGWLGVLLGVGLIAVQLHRKQKALRAPSLTS